jgi:4-hydroxybenzoyl-CoA reductase subunit alpha
MDPAELRLQNVLKPNSITANWLKIGSIGLAECIRQVVARSNWNDRFKKLPKGKGLGLACGSYLCGAGLPIYWNKMPQCGVQLLVDRSGQVTVFCGATEIGQGSDDVLVAIVAEVLGIDPFDIRCVTGDTGITPVDLGSYSSRVTVMMGNAAIDASTKVKNLIAEAAAEQLGVAPDRLDFANGKVSFGDKSLAFAEAAGFAEEKFGTLGSVGSYKPPRSPGRYKGAGVGPSPAYSYTACVVEVDVDQRTGWITVPKIWIAHDIGRTINPVLARGQVEGSVYMGLSEALMEEQIFRRLPPKLSNALVHKIPSLLEYKSLTSLDMPEVDTVLIEDPDPNCPFGAKEAGQGPLLPVMPAVANAIFDAVGVRIDELPITPDKVLKALELKASGKDARVGPTVFPSVPYPDPVVVLPPWEGGDGNAVEGSERPKVKVRSA